MKICGKCKAAMEDNEVICSICNLSEAVKQSEKPVEKKEPVAKKGKK